MSEEKPIDELRSFDDLKALEDRFPKGEQASSPLFLIREKELEISGRVLSSKKKAEQIVADARKKASETLSSAESEGEGAAREVERRMIADAEQEASKILANVDSEVAAVRDHAKAHKADAVKVVIEAVKSV